MKNLLYKDLILLKNSKVFLYFLVFTILCCILSLKLTTMGITYVVFATFLFYNTMSSIEDKYDGKIILSSMIDNEYCIIIEKNIFYSCVLMGVGVSLKLFSIVGFFRLSSVQILLTLILTQILVNIYSLLGDRWNNQMMFLVTLFFSVLSSIVVTLISRKLINDVINIVLFLGGYFLILIIGFIVGFLVMKHKKQN